MPPKGWQCDCPCCVEVLASLDLDGQRLVLEIESYLKERAS